MDRMISQQKAESNTHVFKNAEWIFADSVEEDIVDKYFEYRTTFEIDGKQTDFQQRLYISAYSQYVVYINGSYVDSGQYDGYEDYQVYDALDITPFVKTGSNELYIGQYVSGSDFSTRRKQIPGVIFTVFNIIVFSFSSIDKVNTISGFLNSTFNAFSVLESLCGNIYTHFISYTIRDFKVYTISYMLRNVSYKQNNQLNYELFYCKNIQTC